MVPPPPAPAPKAGPAALDRLDELLGFAPGRLLALVRVADAAALPAVLRTTRARGAAAFTWEGRQLLQLAPGSAAVHWLREGDLATLNLGRELLREHELRVVFVAAPAEADALAHRAPDLYDWIAHRIDGTTLPAPFAAASLRAVLALPGPARIAWWGGRLDDALAEARPGWAIHHLRGDADYDALVAGAERPGWRVWEGVRFAWQEARVRWAEAEAQAEGAAVLDRPGVDLAGWWPVHGDAVDLAALLATGGADLDAALAADLEPEALGSAGPGRPAGPAPWEEPLDLGVLDPWADDPGSAPPDRIVPEPPAWTPERQVAAARLAGPALRALDAAAVEAARATDAQDAEERLARAGWPWLPRLVAWAHAPGAATPAAETPAAATLADALWRLSPHAVSYGVERALRTGRWSGRRIDAAIGDGHRDAARRWLAAEPEGTPEERAWKELRTIQAKPLGPWEEDLPALERIAAGAREGSEMARWARLSLAAVLVELGRPVDAQSLLATTQVDRTGPRLRVEALLDTMVDAELAPREVRAQRLRETRARLAAEGDYTTLAKIGWGEALDAATRGQRAAARAMGAAFRRCMDHACADGGTSRKAAAVFSRPGPEAGTGEPSAHSIQAQVDRDDPASSFDVGVESARLDEDSYIDRVLALARDGRMRPTTRGALLEHARQAAMAAGMGRARGILAAELQRLATTTQSRRMQERASGAQTQEALFSGDQARGRERRRTVLARPRLEDVSRAEVLVYALEEATAGDPSVVRPWIDRALTEQPLPTDPEEWASMLAVLFATPRVSDTVRHRALSHALTVAVRFYDEESASALPTLISLGERWLADQKRELHRAKSARTPDAARLARQVKRLERLLHAARSAGPELLGVDARAGRAALAAPSLLAD